MPTRSQRLARLAPFALLALTATALAVHPQSWTHQTEADFKPGTFDNTIVDNYGELTLSRQIKPIAVPDDVDFVNTFAQTKDGTVYFGTSPGGHVYKIAGGKAEAFYTPPESHDAILTLTTDADGRLLAAACGETARLLRLTETNGKVTATKLFEKDDVTTIWTAKNGPDGALYLGTGPQGKVYRLDADNNAKVVLETGAKNVLALAFDAKGNLLAGTDGNGLIIRQDKDSKKPFVLLDAGKVDVTSLLTDDAGNLFVATAASDLSDVGTEPDEEPGMRSRPGKLEPEPAEPPEEMPPDTMPKPQPKKSDARKAPPDLKPDATRPAPRKKPVGLLDLPPAGINAQLAPPLPPEIKAMIDKIKPAADGDKGDKGDKKPPSKKKESLSSTTAKAKKSPKPSHHAAEEEPEEGSAVYQIAPDGTVRTILREANMNLAMLLRRGELLIGTGPDGKLYSYRPGTDTQALVARVSNENIMTLFAASDSTIYVGASNSGAVYTLGANIAPKGSYTSDVLDASHTATWGHARILATLPDGTSATIATRSGNVRDLKKNDKFWSDWSDEIPAGSARGAALGGGATTGKVPTSPAARFIQYRITLTGDGTPDAATPAVQQVRLAYQVENLPPRLKNLRAEVSSLNNDDEPRSKTPEEGPLREVSITWEATDPNKDELTYRVLYREAGSDTWIQIAKDVTDTSYTWNTRSVPDGRYQIKVIASDAPDNPPAAARSVAQVTAPFTIDNTPPSLADLAAEADGARIKLTGQATDKLSPVTDVRYQIDGEADWHPATPSDKIFDSPSESFTIATRTLAPGNHRITVRAGDSHGNACYHAVNVTVK